MGASSSKKKKDKKDSAGGLSSAFDQLRSGVEQTTQNLAETSQKAVDDATKLASETSDSIKRQVKTTEDQVQKTTTDVTTGLKDKADSVSKATEKAIEDTTAEVERQIQGVTATIQKKSEEAKETVDSKLGQVKSQAEASKTQLKGQVEATASKVNATAENAKNSLNDFSKQSAAAAKNLESQANDFKNTAESKASELKGAAEARASQLKETADNKASELKDAAQKKSSELRGTVDGKTAELKGKAADLKTTVDSRTAELKSSVESRATELRGTVDTKTSEFKSNAEAKAAELKSTVDSKTSELKSSAEAKAAELKSTVGTRATELKSSAEAKATELKSNVDSRTAEFKNNAQAKADELKGAALAKTAEAKEAANTKVSELSGNVEQLKKEADNQKQALQKSLADTQDKVDKGSSELESGVRGNAVGLAEGLKSSVSGAIGGAVQVASDAAHKTVDGVSHSLTKATADVSNTLTGAVNQVSSSVSSTASSVIPGLLSKVGGVSTSLAQGATSLNKMAGSAFGKAVDAVGLEPSVTVCKVDDLQDGEMRVFKVSDDGSILLVKENGQFSALGTKCSHYGAPLVKGVLCNGTVRCPWHGACFSTKTGDIEDSPGLDSIPCYQVTVEDGQVKVHASSELLKHNLRTKALSRRDRADKRTFVIVGGGGAAESCAETLRQNGYTGQLLVLTKEEHLPYDRPKLSKALSSTGKELALRSEDYFKNGDIEVLINHEVISVDVSGKTVKCANNDSFSFDKLLIATGGKPSALDAPGKDLENIFYLRSPGDANNIAEAAKNKNAVIIGTSFIGMEVASYMNGKAKSVVVVGRGKTPFANVFGEEVGEQLKKLCSDKGIKFFTETGVSEFVGTDGKLSAVKLLNGEELPADLCVIGIGVKPSTEFLKGSGIPLTENGLIPVDQNMKTSIEGIYGAGDIVEFPLPLFNKNKVNIGHWQMAQSQGRQAAYSMLEIEKPAPTVPFFWCALFGKSVRYAGYGEDVDEYIIDGDLSDLKFVLYACSGDKVVAVATMGADPVASNFASYICSGKSLSKAEIQSDPKRWIASCGLK